jgi:type II secretory pathway pseudopilin PulG
LSLLEITVGLVIVGLLLGGILKGQEMIVQARIKNIVADFNGTGAAHALYQARYSAVPGDDWNAGSRWATFSALPGGGDGSVSGSYLDLPPSAGLTTADNGNGESLNFWWHLRLAGLISGATAGAQAATPPVNAVGGRIGVQTGGLGLSGIVTCSAGIPDKIARGVDTQLDDEFSDRGLVRARDLSSGSTVTAGSGSTSAEAASSYVETGASQYALCKSI